MHSLVQIASMNLSTYAYAQRARSLIVFSRQVQKHVVQLLQQWLVSIRRTVPVCPWQKGASVALPADEDVRVCRQPRSWLQIRRQMQLCTYDGGARRMARPQLDARHPTTAVGVQQRRHHAPAHPPGVRDAGVIRLAVAWPAAAANLPASSCTSGTPATSIAFLRRWWPWRW